MAQIYPIGTFEIDPSRLAQFNSNADQTARTSGRSDRDLRGDDSVQLSGGASTVGRLAARAAAGSNVRSERVEALRSLVESGRFNPEPRAIADAILREERG